MSDSILNAVSFDVEEFFQVANLRGHFSKESWDETPSRLDIGMQSILQCLERNNTHATFFFLGWIAERRPDVVRACLDAGHEVASHGYDHDYLWDLGPEGLEKDLRLTEEALVAAGAPKPIGFRASTFTLTRDTWWAFDILAERGYRYDSSVHPVRHPVYGVPNFEPGISTVTTDKGDIVEFPVSTLQFLGRNWPVGGGGYFRLLPGPVTNSAVASIMRKGRPASIYLHPWEFDPEQPRYPAPLLKRFRHYLNLDRTMPRLEAMIRRARFGSMREVLEEQGHRFD
ncbi:MAG: polysaccharide deacetylase family protein (PEP-CTERM system associated) [Planctomycetota bacterium]|jgi:polysaccharide deacetylase family protein (PEP-CTERM system associated)